MNFEIFVIDTFFEDYYIDAINEYSKRLSRYCKIKMTKLKDSSSLEAALNEKTHVIQIRPKGRSVSSEDFSRELSNHATSGISSIAFIIGMKYVSADDAISLTSMELSPSLNTVCLYEQIYRAYRIMHGEPYHK
ncbi:MAG: 23S rRNA (pseudouridine(1915)-N(3))-methyltransferase RlmH, partial [Youngiibacter sp.]|nr:23S rRNA (pseudouridine(1915)-N(3))-methyltransferase RlmH [Youngiibacter sp.]